MMHAMTLVRCGNDVGKARALFVLSHLCSNDSAFVHVLLVAERIVQ